MSTRIYNGRCLAAPIGVIYELLIQAKQQSMLLGIALQAETLAKRAVALIDKAHITGKIPERPLATVYRELREQREKIITHRQRDPEADFEFELWLFPRQEDTLCIINTEQESFKAWFDDLPFVSDYAYWNSSDRPQGVSAKQWEQRRKDWDKVLPGAGIPNHRCLRLQMFDHKAPLPFDIEAIAQLAPPVDQRLSELSVQIHRDEAYKRIINENPSENPDAMHSIFENIRLAEKAVAANPQRTAEIRASLEDKVRPITAEDLKPKHPEEVSALRKIA